jgi:hypothetical protein
MRCSECVHENPCGTFQGWLAGNRMWSRRFRQTPEATNRLGWLCARFCFILASGTPPPARANLGPRLREFRNAVMRTNMLAGERRVPSGIRTSAWQVLWPADIGKFFDLSGGTAPQVPLTGVVDAARFQL